MTPFINLGPLAIPTKPFLILTGIYTVLWLVEKTAAQLDFSPQIAADWFTKTLIGAFIGARLIFVINHWEIYTRNPLGIIWPITAGYTFWGGVVGGALTWWLYGYLRQQNHWRSLDIFTPCLLVFYIALRLGDWLGGPGFGAQTSLFGLNRHWVQLYDVAVILLALAIWWWAQPQRPWDGWLALLSTAALCVGLTFTAPFRGDPWLIGNGWLVAQIITVTLFTTCFALLSYFSPNR